jgi:hypothetical protein
VKHAAVDGSGIALVTSSTVQVTLVILVLPVASSTTNIGLLDEESPVLTPAAPPEELPISNGPAKADIERYRICGTPKTKEIWL